LQGQAYLQEHTMPRSTRKNLLLKAQQSLIAIDRLDLYLMDMSELAAGRQPAITELAPTLIQGHQVVRHLWQQLKEQL
jgi:hypothetical protein